MKEPLAHFYSIYGFDKSQIKSIAIGSKYLGVMLNNGQIGVCAMLKNVINIDFDKFIIPDLTRVDHRIFYTAYLNAIVNYENFYTDQKDIFDLIDFKVFNNIVMVGYFRPLVKKFQQAKMSIKVFDLYEEDENVNPIKDRDEELKNADCIILTSTSIFNKTFSEIIDLFPDNSNVFLLGPSSILNEDMFKYNNITKVFGIEFNLHDKRILQVISENHGTRAFLPFARKVYI